MVKFPSSAIIAEANKVLEPYFLALGKVAHAWNLMHEELAQMFCYVARMDNSMGLSIWHALRSDKSQRDLLEHATQAAARDEDWAEDFPKAATDIKWLLSEVQKLSDKRNDAIHAPCHVALGEGEFEIQPVTFFRNPRAKKLYKKDILTEFEWYEASATALRRYAHQISAALLLHDKTAWPERPLLPTLGQEGNRTQQRPQKNEQ
jgi:hypothetical protein